MASISITHFCHTVRINLTSVSAQRSHLKVQRVWNQKTTHLCWMKHCSFVEIYGAHSWAALWKPDLKDSRYSVHAVTAGSHMPQICNGYLVYLYLKVFIKTWSSLYVCLMYIYIKSNNNIYIAVWDPPRKEVGILRNDDFYVVSVFTKWSHTCKILHFIE